MKLEEVDYSKAGAPMKTHKYQVHYTKFCCPGDLMPGICILLLENVDNLTTY